MAYPYIRYRADWIDDDPTKPANADAFDTIEAGIKSVSDILIPSSIVDAKGDLIVATAADAVARKAVGANDKALLAASGQADGLLWDFIKDANIDAAAEIAVSKLAGGAAGQVLQGATPSYEYPPGYQLDYVAITSPVSITATSGATANTCITGTSQAYDGTDILIEVYSPNLIRGTNSLTVVLYDGGTQLGQIGKEGGGSGGTPGHMAVKITPTVATHQYIVKAFVDAGTGTFGANNGAAGNFYPAFIRITKV